jgi:hypothetical protein
MATGDFAWLKLQLAQLAGRNTVAELDNDATLAGQCVNEALLDVYHPTWPGSRRPGWALRNFGIQYQAPVSGTVTVTQGSSTFSALAGVTAAMVGSIIQIGAGYYTLASTTSTVEPIGEPTGAQGFTLWHNSAPVDATSIEIEGDPMVVGYGILRPMTGRGEAIRWRQITFGDFWGPAPYGAGLMLSINWPGGVSQPTGTPIFYWVDNSILSITAAIAPRIVIWPAPIVLTTLQFQSWIVPAELSADADLPVLPANLITRALLPLARERWVFTYKKYAGGNQAFITQEANRAREILNQTATGQRDRPTRQPLKNC